jgi:hypothetical protein
MSRDNSVITCWTKVVRFPVGAGICFFTTTSSVLCNMYRCPSSGTKLPWFDVVVLEIWGSVTYNDRHVMIYNFGWGHKYRGVDGSGGCLVKYNFLQTCFHIKG